MAVVKLEAQVADALTYVNADDRDTWVRMAFAVKNGLGERGFELWDSWSRTSDKYDATSAKSTWRSAKSEGGVTIGSLFHLALEEGWQGDVRAERASPERAAERKARAMLDAAAARKRDERRLAAAAKAIRLCKLAEPAEHPYLAAKGFPKRKMLVHSNHLLIPMWMHTGNQSSAVVGLQSIAPDGSKLFLPGQRSRGAVHVLGGASYRIKTVYVEGFATALSVREALNAMYVRDTRVVATFSASNLEYVARREQREREAQHASWAKALVVADHDLWKCPTSHGCGERWDAPLNPYPQCPKCGNARSLVPPAGQKHAAATGLPWWMPPNPGDANDVHTTDGLNVLIAHLRSLVQAHF